MIDNKDTLIAGAGPAGMATAMQLWRAKKGFTIVEMGSQVGGLAKTMQFGEFRTDVGPHRFFSKNPALYEFIEGILGEQWITVNRFTRFYIRGRFFMYPIQLRDVLTNMGIPNVTRVVFDYALERVKSIWRRAEPRNFGRTLASFNMLNYTEKIWGMPCAELSHEWAQQRIMGLSLASAIKTAVFRGGNRPKTLVDQFNYPEYGAGLVYETIKEKIETDRPVWVNSRVTRVDHERGMVKRVLVARDGAVHSFEPQWFVSSIPITELVDLLEPAVPDTVKAAAQGLRFRSQVYLFMIIDKPQVSPDQWVYFPDQEIPFGRISEMKNFSQKMSPRDKTSLFVEFFCWEGDSIWRASKEELLELAIGWLDRLGFVRRNEVLACHLHRERSVYPVYDLAYRHNLQVVMDYLDQVANLLYIGRPGRFKYTNQDHSLEMGFAAANSIIEGKKYDLDAVGAEREYFEKGRAK